LGTLAACGSALAEPSKVAPPKTAPAKPAQTHARPTQIVLASAEQVRGTSPAAAQANSAPAKRPAPRITTCRCG